MIPLLRPLLGTLGRPAPAGAMCGRGGASTQGGDLRRHAGAKRDARIASGGRRDGSSGGQRGFQSLHAGV